MITQNIPFIDIESSDNYEIGYAIGNVLAEKIHLRKERLRPVFKSKLGASSLKQAADMLKQPTKKFFPQYFEELAGMAEGAKIDIDELILLCAEEEIVQDDTHDRCTTFAITIDGTSLLCHNEDWISGYDEFVYIARVRNPQNSFLSLAYIGDLPGASVLNASGIAFSATSIMQGLQYGVPKGIILRSQIEARTLDQFVALATFSPRAIPNHTMAIDINGNVVSIEATLQDESILRIRAPYAHTNHLVHHPNLKALETRGFRGSKTRLKTAESYLAKNLPSRELAQDILKSHDSKYYPVCRHAEIDRGHAQTVASIVVDTKNMSFTVWVGNPCSAECKTFYL